MASFTGEATRPLGCLVAEIEIGPSKLSTVFFVIDAEPSYNVLLGRDWIHTAKCVPSTLHQKIAFWEDDKIVTVDAAKNPFLSLDGVEEAMFYMDIPPISSANQNIPEAWVGCKLTKAGYLFF